MEIALVFYIILAGVIIYVLGEIIVKIVIDPVQELKRVIAEIAFKLIHYSHVFKLASSDEPGGEAGMESPAVAADSRLDREGSKLSRGYRTRHCCFVRIPSREPVPVTQKLMPWSHSKFFWPK